MKANVIAILEELIMIAFENHDLYLASDLQMQVDKLYREECETNGR